jgi:hypothetical protein
MSKFAPPCRQKNAPPSSREYECTNSVRKISNRPHLQKIEPPRPVDEQSVKRQSLTSSRALC